MNSTLGFRLIAIGFLALLASGCGTLGALQKYPSRQVDRPYTLPKDLNRWRILAFGATASERGQASTLAHVVPWFWEQSITDDFSILWFPLPTSFKVQIWKYPESRSWLGLSFSLLGSPLFLFEDFNLTPYLQLEHRLKISESIAWNTKLHTQMELRRSSDPLHGILSLELAPMFQINDWFTVEPYADLYLELGIPRTGYLPFAPTLRTGNSRLLLPLGLNVTFLLDPSIRQWEMVWTYRYQGSIGPLDYSSHQIFTSLIHYF